MLVPIIYGALVAIFLFAIGLNITQYEWWIAMISLNILFNLPKE